MTSTGRVRLPRDARRAQLLSAAQQVFATKGYHAAGMDDIAERAGVSKPVLYQHFPGKLELYLALLNEHGQDLVRQITRAIDDAPTNKQRVRAAVDTLFGFVESEDQAFRLVFESDLRGEEAVEKAVQEILSGCVQAVAEAVTKSSDLDPEEGRLLAVGLVGLSQVTARDWLDTPNALSRETAVTLVARLAWKGLAGFPQPEQTPEELASE